MAMLGIALVDKPYGISSHDAVNSLRRTLHTKRIGHAGTLDPLATGLLVFAIGPATRFLQYLPIEPKLYIATLKFGQSTTTYDAEGDVSQTKPIPENLDIQLSQIIPEFLGTIEQIPPMFSAIKQNGRPLYELARKGISVERRFRQVTIMKLIINRIEQDEAELEVLCSGGTYIRSLAHDIGQKLGCGAYLKSLRRTQVGKFSINNASSLETISESKIMPLPDALDPLPQVTLNQDETKLITHGMPFIFQTTAWNNNQKVQLIGHEQQFIGIARYSETMLYPECVLPSETIGTFSTSK